MSNLVVFFFGISSLALVTTFQPIRSYFKDLLTQKYFLSFTIPLLILLGWPMDTIETFRVGNELGWLRIARIILFLGTFFHLLAEVVIKRSRILFPRSPVLLLFLVYTIYAAVSALYSVDPLQSLWKAFEILVVLLFVNRLWDTFRNLKKEKQKIAIKQLANSLTYIIYGISVLSIVGGVLVPERAWRSIETYGLMIDSMSGVVPRVNANTLGQMGGTLAFIGISRLMLFRSKYFAGDVFLIGVGILSLLLSYSRTSLITFLVFLFILLIITHKKIFIIPILILYMAGSYFLSDIIIQYLHRGQSVEQFSSLSGRVYMWERAIEFWKKSPWLGHGFYSGHKQIEFGAHGGFLATVDSTYVETLVDLGIIGLILLIIFTIGALYKSWSTFEYCQKYEPDQLGSLIIYISYIGFIIARSFTASSFQVLHYNVIFLLTSIMALDLIQRNKKLYIRKKRTNIV